MTVQIPEVITSFGQQFGADSVCLQRQIPSNPGGRTSQLPVPQEVANAWFELTGEAFRLHQANALMAMRRGEPTAIVAAHPRRLLSMIFLTVIQLIDFPGSQAILLVGDDIAAQVVFDAVEAFVKKIPENEISIAVVSDRSGDVPQAQLLISTYEALHRRMLRFHDRTWRPCWEAVRTVGLVDLHTVAGIGMCHIAALLMRLQRVVHHHARTQVVQWLATSVPVDGLENVLLQLEVGTWCCIPADDYPHDAVEVVVMDMPDDSLTVAHDLAVQLSIAGWTAHIFVGEVEQYLLPAFHPQPNITFGPHFAKAHVLIMAGIADDQWLLAEALRSDYRTVVMMLGAHPIDRWYTQKATRLVENPVLDWPPTAFNAYVLTQHLRAAANELPLRAAEIAKWGAIELAKRLVELQQIRPLPQDQGWVSTGEESAYDDFHVLSAIGLPVSLQIGNKRLETAFDPTSFERWLGIGASVPQWSGGMRVIQRNEEVGTVVLQPDVPHRRTLPLRACDVVIREEKSTRVLRQGVVVTYGRVLVTERVVGMREVIDGGVRDTLFDTPLESRWSAPGWWLDVSLCSDDAALQIGWSVVLTLPLLSMLKTSAVVPCGDATAHRLFMIDAQPGGNGAGEWMYHNIEEVLVTAMAFAQILQADQLMAKTCQLDIAWLRQLIGTRVLAVPAPNVLIPRAVVPAFQNNMPNSRANITPPVNNHDEMYAVIPSTMPGLPSDETAPQKYPPSEIDHDTRVSPQRWWTARNNRNSPTNASSSAAKSQLRPVDNRPPKMQPPSQAESTSVVAKLLQRIANFLTQMEQRRQPTRTARRLATIYLSRPDEIPRFVVGQRIFCLPYGDGDVIASEIVNGREFIRVEFPIHGEIQIDPAFSLVQINPHPDYQNK
ncbi:MAG: hypothetical protein NT020_03455 [Chloroflexales bacterium]|nr:hypothetical protein [Chloroflexales bacterium]